MYLYMEYFVGVSICVMCACIYLYIHGHMYIYHVYTYICIYSDVCLGVTIGGSSDVNRRKLYIESTQHPLM